jgi:glc operon protein GlcG
MNRKHFAALFTGVFATNAFLLSSIARPQQTSLPELPTRKYLDLASIKIMVGAAEAEAKKRNVEVTLCIVDESGNLLFLQKARHAAAYGKPSKDGADAVKNGAVEALAYPEFFPNQGGLPIQVDGRTIGGMAASGAKSEIDEAIVQAALDARFKK